MLRKPAEVAKILGCSEWWVKEQARKRRIPFAWIGGSYRFTDEHLAEIIRLFEVRPLEPRPATPRAAPPTTNGPLRARRPRRAA
ncbi:helix-turn-helix domain-containing protein [Dactylosporangium sp. NPDC051541]|uniref:helix-turn-helix domain-containing protein n=1 Tax=Dactylosporangium sp. NPDC051541 TaxID=3363977 RepID=UPI0037B93392